jgi:hypothetical protein
LLVHSRLLLRPGARSWNASKARPPPSSAGPLAIKLPAVMKHLDALEDAGLFKCGETFRNVEYFRLRDAKVEAIECDFGAPSSFPSAASAA